MNVDKVLPPSSDSSSTHSKFNFNLNLFVEISSSIVFAGITLISIRNMCFSVLKWNTHELSSAQNFLFHVCKNIFLETFKFSINGESKKMHVYVEPEEDEEGIELLNMRSKPQRDLENSGYRGVLLSIDALMDPQHVRLQDEEFARFGRHLTYAYQDIAKLVSDQFSSSQSLLKDAVMPAEGSSPLPEINFISNDLSASLLRFQDALELYPLVKYISANNFYPLVENYIPESLQNITLPEISNAMLVTAHMSIGHLYAWQQPQASIPFYIVESEAKSGSFAARLGVTKFINDYRDELEHNEQTITTTEAIKHCVSTIITYTVPDLLICTTAKAAMPGYKCNDMNLGTKLSFAGSECYAVYKASQKPIEPTTADIVVPYIADLAAGINAYANGYGLLGVVSSIVTADWMSKMVMDMV
jgi:hypothetical protein